MEKDYSLLRPFDLEAAKRGEKLADNEGKGDLEFICGPDKFGRYVFSDKHGRYTCGEPTYVTLKPLAWVEGKPVYRGDVLYHKRIGGDKFVAEKVSANAMDERAIYCDRGTWLSSCELTWQKPKTKREGWVNIYPDSYAFYYETKAKADEYMQLDRIACVRIEWEE